MDNSKNIEKEYAKMEQENKEYDEIFNLGVEAGIKMMMDKIEKHCELGKPVLCNGNLYWLKDAHQNLLDIMDDLEADAE